MQELIVKHQDHVYSVYIGFSLLENKSLFLPLIRGQQVMLISNTTVEPLYLNSIQQIFKNLKCDKIILDDGEQQKNLDNFSKILDALINSGHHRDTTVIAVGGGVINDIAGFSAACYLRGVDFISVPTTLLGQVDAAIGGKTAINHQKGKNLIGAFHQPKAVIIDIETLSSLPDRHFHAGIAEIIKAALIKDAEFFIYLEKNLTLLLNRDREVLFNVIQRACQIKIDIVTEDEKEQSIRALLNFGHTVGHAIESYFQYEQWLHGEAVALGMIIAANLSQQFAGLTHQDYLRICHLIERVGLPTKIPRQVIPQQLLTFILADKKISNNQLRLVLLSNIGKAQLVAVNPQTVLNVIS